MYFRYWGKGRYHVYPKIERNNLLEIIEFIKELLPVKEIEIITQSGKKYKKAKVCRVRGILIKLSKNLNLNHREEYEYVFKPIDKVLLKRGLAIYNMWGYNKGMWQMDGRHIHVDKRRKPTKDTLELKRKLTKLKKKYPEITKSLFEIIKTV